MNGSDGLDIALALVDGLLERGPLGHPIPPQRYTRTLLFSAPFLELFGNAMEDIPLVGPADVVRAPFAFMVDAPEGGLISLNRWDPVTSAVARKAGIPVRSRTLFRERVIMVNQSGFASERRGGWEFITQHVGGSQWLVAHTRKGQTPWVEPVYAKRMPVILGLMWEMRFQWSVEFIGASGMTFVLPTTTDGAREMFADRDKPEGKSRRAALRHWVTAHSRVVRSKDVEVAGHLRCAEPFSWRGYSCRLLPSAVDQERSGKR